MSSGVRGSAVPLGGTERLGASLGTFAARFRGQVDAWYQNATYSGSRDSWAALSSICFDLDDPPSCAYRVGWLFQRPLARNAPSWARDDPLARPAGGN